LNEQGPYVPRDFPEYELKGVPMGAPRIYEDVVISTTSS